MDDEAVDAFTRSCESVLAQRPEYWLCKRAVKVRINRDQLLPICMLHRVGLTMLTLLPAHAGGHPIGLPPLAGLVLEPSGHEGVDREASGTSRRASWCPAFFFSPCLPPLEGSCLAEGLTRAPYLCLTTSTHTLPTPRTARASRRAPVPPGGQRPRSVHAQQRVRPCAAPRLLRLPARRCRAGAARILPRPRGEFPLGRRRAQRALPHGGSVGSDRRRGQRSSGTSC